MELFFNFHSPRDDACFHAVFQQSIQPFARNLNGAQFKHGISPLLNEPIVFKRNLNYSPLPLQIQVGMDRLAFFINFKPRHRAILFQKAAVEF